MPADSSHNLCPTVRIITHRFLFTQFARGRKAGKNFAPRGSSEKRNHLNCVLLLWLNQKQVKLCDDFSVFSDF